MVHPSWTDEEVEELHNAENNMNEVLVNPSSTYTEMCEAIDKFFDAW